VHDVLARSILVDGFDLVYDLDKSEGMYMYDSKSGKRYLDCFSMFASWPISHNHPKMKDPTFQSELIKAAAVNPANSDIYTVDMAKFVSTFHRVAVPPEFKHLFFVQGGALAVENALKAAFDWKVRKNLAAGRGEIGKLVIHFREAFHGRSGYTMSLTNTSDPNKYMYFPLFEWPRIENPKAHFPLEDPENLAKTRAAESRAVGHMIHILETQRHHVAAIIIEPVQGEGGDNHFTCEFWKQLRHLADKYEVMLIADEVQSGMGLTGKWWAYQHHPVVPDIVTFGKKSQVCGMMATKRIDEVKDNVFQLPSRINSTWGGNLVDMVRCKRFLEIIEEDNLVQNSASVGAYFLSQLKKLQQKYPKSLYNVRGKGLMVAFDCFSPAYAAQVRSFAYVEKNALIIGCGTQTIRFRPPLDCSVKEIDIIINLLDSAFSSIGPCSGPSKL
jgi:L-lysine 6-transaminase